MVEHHAFGILLGQKPRHPDVASCCSNEEDTPCQHRQTADEKGYDGRDDTQNDAGHHGSHHVAWDVHRFVAVTIGSQQLPHYTEADALPATLGVAGPSQAMDQFMNHDAHKHEDESCAPVTYASKKFANRFLTCPYPKERHEEHDGCHHHDDYSEYVCLYNIDGHFAAF